MVETLRRTLVGRLSDADAVVEVGVGDRAGVARELAAAGVAVTATDVTACEIPPGVRFVRDDVTDPRRSVYAGADAIYARRLPPDLHRPVRNLARDVGAALLFTTLGFEQPTVPVDRHPVADGTLYVDE